MTYVPLNLELAAFPKVHAFVRHHIEALHLQDVHAMLRLPIQSAGVYAGCNFAITHVLLASVSGTSATLFSQPALGQYGAAFQDLLKQFYPWGSEGGGAPSPAKVADYAELLYKEFRCTFSHRLGLATTEKRGAPPKMLQRSYALKVERWSEDGRDGLQEATLEKLERETPWPFPTMMTSTIKDRPDAKILKVERFYWGIRRMLEDLCESSAHMSAAEAFLTAPP